jgi:long-chain acyl-CoA synthetase
MSSGVIMEGLIRAMGQSRNRIALRQNEKEWSFAELEHAVDRMARRFAVLGIGSGSTVAVLCENRLEVMVAYYATARLGAVFVPINPVLSQSEVAHIVCHCEARILIYDLELASVASAALADRSRRWTFEGLSALDAGHSDNLPPSVSNDGDFLLIYTSGSTGSPKAVVFDQTAEFAGNASLIEMWDIGCTDVTLVALPLGFLYGLSTAAATGLQAGGEVVILRKFHPRDVFKALIERDVTIFHGVPTMFSMMLNFAEAENLQFDLSGVRLLISAGAPLAEDLRQRFEQRFGKRIDDYYALTEARPVFGRHADDPNIPPLGAIGKVAPGVQVHVVGDADRVLGTGEQGELVLRAPGMFRRYAKADEATVKVLSPLGFRTGDIGYYDERSYFYLTGRIKDIIIRGGAKIAPAEVEGALMAHEDVELAAVIGKADATFGEVVAAFVTLRVEAQTTAQELRDHCVRRLAEYKVPAFVKIIASMPLGSTGKIDKTALRAMELAL